MECESHFEELVGGRSLIRRCARLRGLERAEAVRPCSPPGDRRAARLRQTAQRERCRGGRCGAGLTRLPAGRPPGEARISRRLRPLSATMLSGPVCSHCALTARRVARPRARQLATELEQYAAETAGCTRCRLAQTRTQVVFGVGNPHADLMFVGEAPGFHEDKQGFPFVGQAGKLLDRLLGGIGLSRADVYVANVLKCLQVQRARSNSATGAGSALADWCTRGRGHGYVRRRGRSTDCRGRVDWLAFDYHSVTGVVYRVTSLRRAAGSSRVCGRSSTGDHPVLTERGYVAARGAAAETELAVRPWLEPRPGVGRCLRHACWETLKPCSLEASLFGHSERQWSYAALKAGASRRNCGPRSPQSRQVPPPLAARLLSGRIARRTRCPPGSTADFDARFYGREEAVPEWSPSS